MKKKKSVCKRIGTVQICTIQGFTIIGKTKESKIHSSVNQRRCLDRLATPPPRSTSLPWVITRQVDTAGSPALCYIWSCNSQGGFLCFSQPRRQLISFVNSSCFFWEIGKFFSRKRELSVGLYLDKNTVHLFSGNEPRTFALSYIPPSFLFQD